MPFRISRSDDEFVAINHFSYYHYPGDAYCSVQCIARLLLPGGVLLRLEPVDPRRPFAGILDASGRVANSVPVSAGNNGEEFQLGISPPLLFDALDRELPKLSFRDNTGSQAVRITIDAFRVSSGNPALYDRIQVETEADIKAEIGPKDAAAREAGEDRLPHFPMPRLRRNDRSFSRNDLAMTVGPEGTAGSPIRIQINQGAQRRFAREALFAFAPHSRRGLGEEDIYPFVFARLSVADFGAAELSPLRSIVLCLATDVPVDQMTDDQTDRASAIVAPPAEEKTGWELSRISALTEPAAELRGPAYAALYRLSVAQTYALCVELTALQFEIERLFAGQRDGLAVELALFRSPALDDPLEVYQLEFALSRSERRLLLVSSESGHCAAAIDVDGVGGAAPSNATVISLLERAPGRRIVATVRNLSHDRVECQVTTSPRGLDRIPLAPGAAKPFDLELVGGRSWLRIGNAKVDFEILPPAEARVVALDIGTMAMSMATGSVAGGAIDAVLLGEMVKQSIPVSKPDRREAEYSKLMSSACGITILEGNGSARPVQFHRDRRLAIWQQKGRHKDDLLARLELTKAPLEIHLPLYDRGHEDLDDSQNQQFGLVSIASVKTQICTNPLLKPSSLLWTHAAHLTAPDRREDMPLQMVETQTLLAAALDALLYVYSPAGVDDREAAERDWDFVLTHPASIGVDARQRYFDALSYIVNKKQVDFDRYLDRRRPGNRGRVRLRLVSEPVAACWALLHSGRLSPRQTGKLRRLVLFDIGAGTFDVSALEIYRDKTDEIVSQTVCFSVPLGGDTLDRAIAWDYLSNLTFKEHHADEGVSSDLLSRVEAGKRVRNFAPWYLPIPMAERSAGITPIKGDEFVGWNRPASAAQFLPSGAREPVKWAMIDLEDRSEANASREAYLRVVRKLIVEPTLRACGRYDETFVDVDVVISGRAAFFTPIRETIQEAVDSACQTRKLPVRLACDVLSGSSAETRGAPSPEAAELMKGLVARGAAVWSRNASLRDETKTIEQPPRAIHALSSFAIVIGVWDYESCGFERLQELRDIRVGRQEFELPPGGNAFIATRPPFVSADDVKAARGDGLLDDAQTGSEQDDEQSIGQFFTRELIDRCIRPIALENVETLGVTKGSPLPYVRTGLVPDVHGAILRKIRLAEARDSVTLDCSVEGNGQVHLRATVNGEARGCWTLSSTFMVQEG
jgi:hypothetical protein